MKRWILLIACIIFLFEVFYKHHQHLKIIESRNRIDSLQIELMDVQKKITNLVVASTQISDTVFIQYDDSTLLSHDKQIRWLQWHIEQLRK